MGAIKTIVYSSHFERAMQKLPLELQMDVKKRETIFRRDCFDPILKTHKLKGIYRNHWSFSITYKYRVVFRFISPDTIYFIDVGDHSIYQ